MLIASSVDLPIDTKEPSEGICQFIEILRQKASNLEKINITLGIISRTYPDILVNIAKHLPESADGFGLDRSVTAGQFLEACNAGNTPTPSACTCDITDYLSVSNSLSLIESFFDESRRAIRSTSFTIHAKNISWKGDESNSTGKLNLFDLKSFGHKKRFSLTASYCCRGQDDKDPKVKEIFSEITQCTNIAFDKGVISTGVDPEILAQLSNDQLLVAQKCFDEALEEAGREIRKKKLDWQILPGLASHRESFDRRMESVMTGKKERVNFPSVIRRFMKEQFPDFKPCKYFSGERLLLTKKVSPEMEFILGFDRIHMMGFGKAFTLLLGAKFIEGPLVGQRFDKNLFHLFQQNIPPCWTYVTKDDLIEVLNEMSNFLKTIVKSFEGQLVKYLSPVPSTLPNGTINRGAISAKQALNEASKVSLNWSDDASLYCIASSGILRLREAGMGPMINIHGLLNPHGCWSFYFYSHVQNKSLIVSVPSIGSVHCEECDYGTQPFGSAGESVFPSPVDNWIDSDKAMEIAEENGGQDAREEAYSCWDIIIKLKTFDPAVAAKTAIEHYGKDWSQNDQKSMDEYILKWSSKDIPKGFHWTVEYLINKTKNTRGDVKISFDAISGKNVKVSPF